MTPPRCPASDTPFDATGLDSRIIDCPRSACGRPVTVRENGLIAKHRRDRTYNTEAADVRLREMREARIR